MRPPVLGIIISGVVLAALVAASRPLSTQHPKTSSRASSKPRECVKKTKPRREKVPPTGPSPA